MELGIEGLGPATEIGSGASAVVYRSTQIDLDREVAVKVLSNTEDAFLRRFEREARTLGRLSQHQGIVTVYQSGTTDSGHPYLILELCETSVLGRLRQIGRFEPLEACAAMAQVADAVDAAHREGVVHRDIKPANVLLGSGRYMVSDFGISTVTGATTGHTDSIGFTAGYVAPETLQGNAPGPAADVYALGATLFHLLSGEPPHVDPEQSANLLALAQRVIHDPVPDLRDDGVPDDVQHIVEVAMAKDPADRPSARLLHEYLTAATEGREVQFVALAKPVDDEPDTDDELETDGEVDGAEELDHLDPDADAAVEGELDADAEPGDVDIDLTDVEHTNTDADTNGVGVGDGDEVGDEVDEMAVLPVTAEHDAVVIDDAVTGSDSDNGSAADAVNGTNGEYPQLDLDTTDPGLGVGAAGLAGAAAVGLAGAAAVSDTDASWAPPSVPDDATETLATVGGPPEAAEASAAETLATTTSNFDPTTELPAGAPVTPITVTTSGPTADTPVDPGGQTVVYSPPASPDGTAVMPGGFASPPPPTADGNGWAPPSTPPSTPPPADGFSNGLGAPPPPTALPSAPDPDGDATNILASTPTVATDGQAPTPEERRYWFTEDDRRSLGPLLLVGALGLLLMMVIGAFLVINGGDDAVDTDEATDRVATDDTTPAAGDSVRSSTGLAELADVVGLNQNDARRRLEAQGFVVTTRDVENNEVVEGTVVGQSPSAGESAEVGSTIELSIAIPDGVEVPLLSGLTLDEAEAKLTEIGLVGQATEEFSEEIAKGQVMSSDPEAGEFVEPGAGVSIVVSAGPRPPTCGEVTGGGLQSARAGFERAGFTVRTSTGYSDTVPAGNVASCSLDGSTASLVVSDGREPCSEAIGSELEAGRARLEERGFAVSDTGAPATEGVAGQIDGCTIEGEAAAITYITAVVPGDCSNLNGQNRGDARRGLEELGFVDIRIVEERNPNVPSPQVISCTVEGTSATLTVSLGPAKGDLRVRLEQLVLAGGQDCGGEGVRPDLFGDVTFSYADKSHSPRNAIRRPNRNGVVEIGASRTWDGMQFGQELTLSWNLADNDGFFRDDDFVGAGSASIVLDGTNQTWQPNSGGGDACQFSWLVTVEWSPSDGGDDDDD